ncbi:MAG: DUF2589 domain-containing protein [Motiliproteus sp.]
MADSEQQGSGDGSQPPAEPPIQGTGDGRAADTDISLEQALLAPLDSILKAQVHSARSFLNLILQLGYPDASDPDSDGQPYSLKFKYVDGEGGEQWVSIPALSLVPIAPLAVDSASFDLEMAVRKITKSRQMRTSVATEEQASADRPWFLVEKPVNIQGVIAPPSQGQSEHHNEAQSSIKISINVKSIPMPAGLSKLLTSLTQMGQIDAPASDSDDQADNSGSSGPSPEA